MEVGNMSSLVFLAVNERSREWKEARDAWLDRASGLAAASTLRSKQQPCSSAWPQLHLPCSCLWLCFTDTPLPGVTQSIASRVKFCIHNGHICQWSCTSKEACISWKSAQENACPLGLEAQGQEPGWECVHWDSTALPLAAVGIQEEHRNTCQGWSWPPAHG